jgi:hypothetical protein
MLLQLALADTMQAGAVIQVIQIPGPRHAHDQPRILQPIAMADNSINRWPAVSVQWRVEIAFAH